MLRTILAILAGIVVLTVVSFAIEFAVNAIWPESVKTLPMQVFTSAYSLAAVALGGYVTARITRLRDAVIMGVLELIMTIDVVFFVIKVDHPLWLTIAGLALMVPAAWLGGLLRESGLLRR